MRKGVSVAVLLVALGGCGTDDTGSDAAGAGGATAGSMAGSGTAAGVSGTVAAGSGGAAGAGAGGMAGGTASVPGCEAADASVMGSAAHSAALQVLAATAEVPSPCGFSACHTTTSGKAQLNLLLQTDLRTLLVGVPSCELPAIVLVADGGGQAALDNSWLWIKLTGPAGADGALESNPAWGTAMSCGQMGGQPYGARMPLSNTDALLETARLAAIRNWICAGAPGP